MSYFRRPGKNEYADFYSNYIQSVPEGDLIELMRDNMEKSLELFWSVTEEKSQFRYAERKWSIRELLGHIIDAERVFSYRALRFSRNDKTNLPGFDENDFIKHSNYDRRSLNSLISEYEHLRKSNIIMFAGLKEEMWELTGTANNAPISVRALGCIVIGHENHHIKILKERYLLG